MPIQMVDLETQYRKLKPEIDAALTRVLESCQFVLGSEVAECERAVADYIHARYAVGCASGTDALQLAAMALGLKAGDEVITTPFTFVATAEAMALLGIVPVYVDIDERTYNLDPDLVEKAVTPRTKAILPVHLFGQPADLDTIRATAERHRLFVIEDAAQALGATYHGEKVGALGNIGCTSFFPSKNLGAYGDAGMVFTNDEKLAAAVRMIAQHGSRVRYSHEVLGVNSRLDTLQAAVLTVKLRYLDEWNKARVHNAEIYTTCLTASSVIKPFSAPDRTHIFHQYSIRVPRREALIKHLTAKAIPTAVYYPIPLHLQEAFRGVGGARNSPGSFPVAERIAGEILSLPMHPELDETEIRYIAEEVNRFCASTER